MRPLFVISQIPNCLCNRFNTSARHFDGNARVPIHGPGYPCLRLALSNGPLRRHLGHNMFYRRFVQYNNVIMKAQEALVGFQGPV